MSLGNFFFFSSMWFENHMESCRNNITILPPLSSNWPITRIGPKANEGSPTANGDNVDEPGAVYTVGPPPEKLLRDLQQQLQRLFAAKPAEKFPILMGNTSHQFRY